MAIISPTWGVVVRLDRGNMCTVPGALRVLSKWQLLFSVPSSVSIFLNLLPDVVSPQAVLLLTKLFSKAKRCPISPDLSLLSPNATLPVLFHILLEPSLFFPFLMQAVSSLFAWLYVFFLQDSICVFFFFFFFIF